MKKTVYGGEISPRCEYCETGIKTNSGKEILCRRKGIMQPESCCKKFKYDPLRRAPKIQELPTDHKAEDFSL